MHSSNEQAQEANYPSYPPRSVHHLKGRSYSWRLRLGYVGVAKPKLGSLATENVRRAQVMEGKRKDMYKDRKVAISSGRRQNVSTKTPEWMKFWALVFLLDQDNLAQQRMEDTQTI